MRTLFASLPPIALALLALALQPTDARADCASGALWAWPAAETALPLQPMILLDGYGDQRADIASLAHGGIAALVSDGHTVMLEVEVIHIGAHSVTQAVLRPAEPLKPKTRYALHLQRMDRFVPGEPAPKPGPSLVTWTTTDRAPAALVATEPPRVGEPTFVEFGCGPASNMHVTVPATSGAPIAVEVELTEVGGAVRTYALPLRDGQVTIGHDMCSGPFDVTGANRRFVAELTVRDAAGRRAKPQTVRFGGVPRTDRPR